MSNRPMFRTLTTSECLALLESQHVGRMAFTFRDRVDIEPVHYVCKDHCIWGRTQHGTKVAILAHHPWVAFEVDKVDTLVSWQSVVVRGRVEFPDPEGGARDQARYAAGVSAFRDLVPEAFTSDDPTPERDLVFVLPVAECEGRAASPRER
jgi:nitroimidazol reductase NimA-like FMN-containing flavoprotein (pyridoxamine 5'-phosphate oxidase superfamily)